MSLPKNEPKAEYSEVDGLTQHWLVFAQPIYVQNGDLVNIAMPDQQMVSWDITRAMVLVGCDLQGWPIETVDDQLQSVQYDTVTRYFPEEYA